MHGRKTDWPRSWLMTDERMGERLWKAIDRLPIDAGIVLRHHATPRAIRVMLALRIADICRRRGFTLAIAGDEELALSAGADLLHNPRDVPVGLPFSRSVHTPAEADAAKADGASLVFVSPVLATSSHPEQTPLGPAGARRIAQIAEAPAIALGGMNANNFPRLAQEGFHGWAGIDAWLGEGD